MSFCECCILHITSSVEKKNTLKNQIYKAGGKRGFYISNKFSDPMWLFLNIHDNILRTLFLLY